MLGIMSGRLSLPIDNQIQAFPHKTWRDEFALAKSYGFDCIEWVYEDRNKSENPILSDSGINELKLLSKKTGVSINSIVADNFMFEKFFGDEKNVNDSCKSLLMLIDQVNKAEIRLLELPIMGEASLAKKKARDQALEYLKPMVEYAKEKNIEIIFELDLKPDIFIDFINRLESDNVGINYDMGNSAMFGYDPKVEISLYKDLIKNVHIKDGVYKGSTVPLGKGDTNFPLVFRLLREINYNGDYIFQAAREDLFGSKKRIKDTIKSYIKFVSKYLI